MVTVVGKEGADSASHTQYSPGTWGMGVLIDKNHTPSLVRKWGEFFFFESEIESCIHMFTPRKHYPYRHRVYTGEWVRFVHTIGDRRHAVQSGRTHCIQLLDFTVYCLQLIN